MNPQLQQQFQAYQQALAQQMPQQQGGIAPQTIMPNSTNPINDTLSAYGAALSGGVPSALEQALHMASQYMSGHPSPVLQNAGKILGQAIGRFTPGAMGTLGAGMQGGTMGAAGAALGNALQPGHQQMIDGTQFQYAQPKVMPQMQPLGGMSTGPNQYNIVTPQGNVVGQGGMGIPASQYSAGSGQMPNPYLQMLQQMRQPKM